MCIGQQTVCYQCGLDTDGLMTCYYVHDDTTIKLCPNCMVESGDFCFGCGVFSSGTEGFDIIHPGYCDNCWDEFDSEDWDGEEFEDPCDIDVHN